MSTERPTAINALLVTTASELSADAVVQMNTMLILMICIFSSILDQSTTEVMKWLHFLGEADVIRVNHDETDIHHPILIDIREEDFFFTWDHRRIALKDIKAVWYRKGKNWFCNQFAQGAIDGHAKFTDYLNRKLYHEETKLTEYLHFMIQENVPSTGAFDKCDLNKLSVLREAKKVGFRIPRFYISNHKEGIGEIINTVPSLITKAMSDGLYLFEKAEKETGYFTYTELVQKSILTFLPSVISPSFLQETIEKRFDLRVFFLKGECYAMAILSQADERTKVDFRKYNEDKPNRSVPYALPIEIKSRIHRLFDVLQLNTGSVDLIVDRHGNFYFLEINPVGQFGMMSVPCNYFLEKKVALTLMEP